MGAIADRIRAAISDIDSAIKAEQARNASTIASLASKKADLEATLPLVTDRLEGAVEALQRHGFLRTL